MKYYISLLFFLIYHSQLGTGAFGDLFPKTIGHFLACRHRTIAVANCFFNAVKVKNVNI